MKPLERPRTAVTGGVTREEDYAIAEEDLPLVLDIIFEKLYTDPIAAAIRETCSNAWDAHLVVGKGDVPFEVTLPNDFDKEFIVRDYGPGMSEQEIFTVARMAGKSTKKGTNKQKGMFGLGFKAPHAYTSAFTIVSRNGGRKITYSSYRNAEKRYRIAKMLDEDVELNDDGTPCTGLEIRIPVQNQDVSEFKSEMQRLLRYYDPLPINNAGVQKMEGGFMLPETNVRVMTPRHHADAYHSYSTTLTVVMGNVPYEVSNKALRESATQNDVLQSRLLSKARLVLYAEIGDVQPNPSREGLNLSDQTLKWVKDKVAAAKDEFARVLHARIEEGSTSSWARRRAIKAAYEEYELTMPHDLQKEINGVVKIEDSNRPTSFTIRHIEHKKQNGSRRKSAVLVPTKWIPKWRKNTRLVVRDCDKPLKRLRLHEHETLFLIDPNEGYDSWDHNDLTTWLKANKLDGMPEDVLSSYSLAREQRGSDAIGRRPHHAKSKAVFEFAPNNRRLRVDSDFWNIYQDEVPDDAVYVPLYRFKVELNSPHYRAVNGHTLREMLRRDEGLLRKLFGFSDDMPDVFGVKTNYLAGGKFPKKIPSYMEWITARIEEGLRSNPLIQAQIKKWAWGIDAPNQLKAMSRGLPAKLIAAGLPKSHPLLAMNERIVANRALWKAIPGDRRGNIKRLVDTMKVLDIAQKHALNLTDRLTKKFHALLDPYPLLRAGDGKNGQFFYVRWWHEDQEEIDAVVDYITMMDKRNAQKKKRVTKPKTRKKESKS